MSDLDEIDQKIIEVLTKNSRISLRDIAKETEVSVDTIARRYARLEKERIIQPVITVNLCKLGYEAIVFFAIKVSSQGELRQITEQVAHVADVVAVMETNGECDLMVNAAVRNVKHTFFIGEEIMKVPGVRSVTISMFMLPPKEMSVYPPPIWHNLDINGK